MYFILSALITSLLNMALPFILNLINQIANFAFEADKFLGEYFVTAYDVMYNIGISMIILKFMKKGFEIYVLWTDGDPDNEPIQLLINLVKAMAVAIGFRPIYDIFVSVLKEALDSIIVPIKISLNHDVLSTAIPALDVLPAIVILVGFIMFVILSVRALSLGIQLIILNIGMPLSCVGLLDNDKGVFKNYFMSYAKTFLTILIQIVLMKVGVAILFTNVTSGNVFMMICGIAVLVMAMKTPNLLQEWLVPASPGGGMMHKAYSMSMMASMVHRVVK